MGLTGTSGCFLGFLELEIKHKVKILMSTQVLYWSFPGPLLRWGLLDAKEHRRSSTEGHRKAGDSPTRAIMAGEATSEVIKSLADRSS